MYDTCGTRSVCDYVAIDYDVNARIGWLKAELARADETAVKRARGGEDEAADFALAPAFAPAEAYKRFGALLGLLPPAAIFWHILSHAFSAATERDNLMLPFVLCLGMGAVCCVVGKYMGAYAGRLLGDPRRHSRAGLVFKSMLLAVLWAVLTGGAGGAVCFGFGAIFGAVFALPVALAAFPVFAVLHRLHARGGMIEERSLWPLAYGVPGVAAALILSLG
jgi:hypothetical protein